MQQNSCQNVHGSGSFFGCNAPGMENLQHVCAVIVDCAFSLVHPGLFPNVIPNPNPALIWHWLIDFWLNHATLSCILGGCAETEEIFEDSGDNMEECDAPSRDESPDTNMVE